jgi:hypothetical protein
MRQRIEDRYDLPDILKRGRPALVVAMVDNIDKVRTVPIVAISSSQTDGCMALLIIEDNLLGCGLDGPLNPPCGNPHPVSVGNIGPSLFEEMEGFLIEDPDPCPFQDLQGTIVKDLDLRIGQTTVIGGIQGDEIRLHRFISFISFRS